MMNAKDHEKLRERVTRAAEAALKARNSVSPLDVFLGIGWIDGGTVKRWRQGQIECLERAMQTRPERVAEAVALLGAWAQANGLVASETSYAALRPGQPAPRFSASGDPALEARYRTHWISGALSAKQRARVAEKANRAPELVVVQPLNDKWTCHRCGGSGDLLIMENPGPACLRCAGLGDLVFLPAGDAKLTRRVKAASTRYAVVVRFARARGRYERQGLLVEPQALAEHEGSVERSDTHRTAENQ